MKLTQKEQESGYRIERGIDKDYKLLPESVVGSMINSLNNFPLMTSEELNSL
jgi:hypothetical protein